MIFSPWSFFGWPVAAAAMSFGLTALVRQWALRRSMIDHPNSRSSHTIPTPRGGGLAIVIVVALFLLCSATFELLDARTLTAVAGGCAAVAFIGWLDDMRSVRASTRLLFHFAAAGWAVWWLGGLPEVQLGTQRIALGWPGSVLATVGLVWVTNLFNFMDGIDGIAGVEALSLGLFGGLLLLFVGAGPIGLLALVIAGTVLGFLGWNWQPAQIFLGDIGSGFLGFIFGVLAIASEKQHAVPVFLWAVLAAVFIFDATVTLLRRGSPRRWAHAHRSHAYQRAVQAGWSHARVATTVGVINIVLAGLAWRALVDERLTLPLLVIALVVVGAAFGVVERVRPVGANPQ